MELLGNEELLNHPLVAFFASRNAPPEAWKRAREWAQSISRSDKVVISGFHSPIERAVCDVLLENNRPIVVTLGRALYKKIPSHLLPAREPTIITAPFPAQQSNFSTYFVIRKNVYSRFFVTLGDFSNVYGV